jgi:hypothetical protein
VKWNGTVWLGQNIWAHWGLPREDCTVQLSVCRKHPKRGSDRLDVELSNWLRHPVSTAGFHRRIRGLPHRT